MRYHQQLILYHSIIDELEKASSKIFELKQELRVEIEKFSDSQANELSLKATLASNEHELAQSVKMTLWLTSELETKSNEFISYRKEKVHIIGRERIDHGFYRVTKSKHCNQV